MSERIRPITLTDAAEAVCGKNALVVCHVNPDGDAVGSAAALAEVLKLTGGSGKVVTPTAVPDRLAFITGTDTAYTEGMEKDFDIILAVDTASPSQLGHLSHLADKVAISFDHHENCTLYSPYVLYGRAAAAGLVVLDLLFELERAGKISGDTAPVLRRLFAAIASDTGSFKYSNTDESTFAAASEICRRLAGAPTGGEFPIDNMSTADISAALFDTVTKKDIAVRQIAYKNLQYIADGRIAVSTASHAEYKGAGLTLDDLGGMVECVRSIGGTAVGICLKESARGIWRGSARANIDFDVSVPAAALSGGGHRRAAGFTVEVRTAAEAVAVVEKTFGEALEKDE